MLRPAPRPLGEGALARQPLHPNPQQQQVLVHQRGLEPRVGLTPLGRHPVVAVLGGEREPLLEAPVVQEAGPRGRRTRPARAGRCGRLRRPARGAPGRRRARGPRSARRVRAGRPRRGLPGRSPRPRAGPRRDPPPPGPARPAARRSARRAPHPRSRPTRARRRSTGPRRAPRSKPAPARATALPRVGARVRIAHSAASRAGSGMDASMYLRQARNWLRICRSVVPLSTATGSSSSPGS